MDPASCPHEREFLPLVSGVPLEGEVEERLKTHLEGCARCRERMHRLRSEVQGIEHPLAEGRIAPGAPAAPRPDFPPAPGGALETVSLSGGGAEGRPDRVGPYKILDVLGMGGMGVVYLAEQEKPIRRRVALKLVKLGMDTKEVIARFESERQALALMDHPNIARVYDAGVSEDGRPYFVMECVQGLPITIYCERHRLSIQERLRLFVQVCQGVQHAHYRGIIHRDLKPSNILVTVPDAEPIAKIIDFGVAKATSQKLTEKTIYTELGRAVGTPAYMSPEQAGMTPESVDYRTDIYSLGVVLYELLIGDLPLDWEALSKAAYDEILRRIREEDPPTPSTRLSRLNVERTSKLAAERKTSLRLLKSELRKDLDWITMKALEKERSRRYDSASEFAADIGRYLRCEPVLAGPPSVLYRARKFARKHRTKISTAAIFAGLVLAAGVFWWLQPASLSVRSHPEGARVLLDGRLLGTTPIEEVRAAPGEHTVRVEKDEFLPSEESMVLGRGQGRLLEKTLSSVYGNLEVTTDPPGAMVLVLDAAGKPVGPEQSTPMLQRLLAGEYRVSARLAAAPAQEKDVTVSPGGNLETVRFAWPTGFLDLWAPFGHGMRVDVHGAADDGSGPLHAITLPSEEPLQLFEGTYRLRASLENCLSRTSMPWSGRGRPPAWACSFPKWSALWTSTSRVG